MATGELKLGRAWGIDIRLHWTFFALPLLIAGISYRQADPPAVLALRLVFMIAILASVLLHEMGHALVARAIGIGTRDILITPLCGLARLERSPENWASEIAVSLAGPLSNGIFAGLVALATLLAGGNLDLGGHITETGFPAALFWINLALFGINLFPIFPMDGGRVLRALLSHPLGSRQATIVAARSGQIASVGGIIWGLMAWNIPLLLIGIFLVIAAQHELDSLERTDH